MRARPAIRRSYHGCARLTLAAGALAACGSSIGDHPDGYNFGIRGDAAGEAAGGGTSTSSTMPTKPNAKPKPDATMTMPLPDDAGLGPGGDCPASARLIYVTGVEEETDTGRTLYSFNPEVGQFTKIGAMTCLSSPTHMTVDRQGSAWVVSEGEIYKASTTTAACTKVSTWKADPVNFPDFALTFLGTTSATDDSLYILGDSGELGVFDVTTGAVTNAGMVSLRPAGDMTTNGDGTLYFLIQQSMQTLNELDPTNATVIQSWTTGEDSQNTQALAYYGGLFFDFIGDSVYTFDTQSGVVNAIGTAPIYVTGAGQSTCVPTDAGPPPMLR